MSTSSNFINLNHQLQDAINLLRQWGDCIAMNENSEEQLKEYAELLKDKVLSTIPTMNEFELYKSKFVEILKTSLCTEEQKILANSDVSKGKHGKSETDEKLAKERKVIIDKLARWCKKFAKLIYEDEKLLEKKGNNKEKKRKHIDIEEFPKTIQEYIIIVTLNCEEHYRKMIEITIKDDVDTRMEEDNSYKTC